METLLINYDLLQKKCKNCNEKNRATNDILTNKDLFFCSKSSDEYFNNENFTQNMCVKCFNEFVLNKIDFSQYNIWKITK